MTRFLPLFPLNIVVFPGEKLNLHIFEPRYKQLIAECEAEGKTFGIVPFIDNKLMPIGTEIRLRRIEKRYPNGEMDIRTEGVGLFAWTDFFPQAAGKLYPAGEVVSKPVVYGGNYLNQETILHYVRDMFEVMNIKKTVPIHSTDFTTFSIAHYVGFSLDQEYAFLGLPDEEAREVFMLEHLKNMLPVVQEMEHLRQRALLNGHFKNIVPPAI